jgi:hypothetical protein
MVIIEGLLIKVVFNVIQHPLNPLYPVVKDEFQFRPLNVTQKFLNASEKISGVGTCCRVGAAFTYPQSQKSELAKAGSWGGSVDGVLE